MELVDLRKFKMINSNPDKYLGMIEKLADKITESEVDYFEK